MIKIFSGVNRLTAAHHATPALEVWPSSKWAVYEKNHTCIFILGLELLKHFSVQHVHRLMPSLSISP